MKVEAALFMLIVNICHRFGVFDLIREATDCNKNIFGSDSLTLCQV